MRIVLVFVLLFLNGSLICQNQLSSSKKEGDFIYWNKNRLLKWTDFKGSSKDVKINKKIPKNYIAISNVSIDFKFVKNGYNDVQAIFDKRKSIKRRKNPDSNVLRHEQYHFNITELYVRKFRKKIRQEDVNIKIELLNEIFKQIREEHLKYQIEFDEQTSHGSDIIKEMDWELKIDEEMKALVEFESN